jgi:hypothetical protein
MYTWALRDNEALLDEREPAKRLKIITNGLFKVVYCRVSRGMLNKDRMLLAFLLTQSYIKCADRW